MRQVSDHTEHSRNCRFDLSFTSKITQLLLLLFAAGVLMQQSLNAQDNNNLIEITGKVLAQEKKEPLSDVSVQVKGTVSGTITNKAGDFKLRTRTKLPFTLVFSSVGFKEQEFEVKSLGSDLQIELSTQTVLGNEVVVTASRVAESILKSPVAIEKLDITGHPRSSGTQFL